MRDQVKTKIGVSRTRLKNLANVVQNILGKVGLYDDMPELESEISPEQGRNQRGQGHKILTTNQMLNRLPVTLAQLNSVLYSLYRSKKTYIANL